MNRIMFQLLIICNFLVSIINAQFASVGGGLLVSERPLEPIAEFNIQTTSFWESRGYATLSWTDASVLPTLITAVERSVFKIEDTFSTSAGLGLLMIEPNNYKPDLMFVSSTVVPIPVPNTSFILIGSTLPLKDFDWSLVFKIGWAFWFRG